MIERILSTFMWPWGLSAIDWYLSAIESMCKLSTSLTAASTGRLPA